MWQEIRNSNGNIPNIVLYKANSSASVSELNTFDKRQANMNKRDVDYVMIEEEEEEKDIANSKQHVIADDEMNCRILCDNLYSVM